MSLKKKIYLSPLGLLISIVQNVLSFFHRPFMVYGYFCKKNRKLFKNTRISSTVTIVNPENLEIGDNCWVWHNSVIDASNGVTIGRGVQIGAFVGIFTHSSHVSIRLLGENFINIDGQDRVGYVRAPVVIGDYSFIATNAVIMPGTTIGKGCVIGAGAVVKGKIPDFSVVAGNPGKIVGSTDAFDRRYIDNEMVAKSYFDPAHFKTLKTPTEEKNNG